MSNFRLRNRNVSRSFLALATFGLLACGPSLSEPSSHDISGRWSSATAIGPVTQIVVDVKQQAGGIIEGQWSGKVSQPNVPCPPDLGLAPTGGVNGTNAVLGVRWALLGVGDFQGQIIDDHTLRGSFTSCDVIFAITFSLVGPVPGG